MADNECSHSWLMLINGQVYVAADSKRKIQEVMNYYKDSYMRDGWTIESQSHSGYMLKLEFVNAKPTLLNVRVVKRGEY